ncbi:MAG: sensor domain-containing diguanylate cyclase [Faecalicatena sp.]|uniref:sensor domain-containing diguanylate cyclase n=1 Tax=Faecalicatena sp. TaxID=2005360 RepID=UPI002587DDB3|nr:sensor domain-containing diguanylate cyclase [Faecalicatena sp.]MCI6463892.1 sensor domain-containing diguanylate cyclase [Faecalicatena sp.]MDY5620792.1 sensor domain-containing diguanylate cyclase [Lachnospiraceae bacterium]
METDRKRRVHLWYAAVFLIVNIIGIFIIYKKEKSYISKSLNSHTELSMEKAEDVMDNYTHSFELFSYMLTREIKNHPDPDYIWDYLKTVDSKMLEIEGDTYDGLYMYYKGRYLYSWDTPYSQYESTGYVATERPWYKAAEAGNGEIVFTPPYMSYANHYILSTISQLQPDNETVFAYDIKMGDIQNLVTTLKTYDQEQMMIFDNNGTIVGSTNENYLGGVLYNTLDETAAALKDAQDAYENAGDITDTEKDKLKEQMDSLDAFYSFQQEFGQEFTALSGSPEKVMKMKLGSKSYYGYLLNGEDYHFLVLVPVLSMLKDTVQVWLIPLLIMELLLIYLFGRVIKSQKNKELHQAYVELGQTQKRLEIALSAAQKAAAIDDLTGLMNFASFQRGVSSILNSMGSDESGILIMIDGDHFKAVNDNYGHSIGDEVIKLSAQMIVGRIRTIDLASRLHGDEFAIFVSKTNDYTVADRIMQDINHTMAEEAAKRNLPAITLSSGAVIARRGDNYAALAKEADEALYEAKQSHDGGFASSRSA